MILIFALTALFGCDTDRVSKLERQNAELKAQAEKVRDFDLQAKCSTDSEAWFREHWEAVRGAKSTLSLDYTNHYNQLSNKCFILVEYHYGASVSSSWTNNIALYDVYENVKYGQLGDSHYVGLNSGMGDNVVTCEILDKKCATVEQFNGMVQPYMNN